MFGRGAEFKAWKERPRSQSGGSCASSAAAAARLFVGAEDLRRGQNSPITHSTNHKDAVRIKWSGRAYGACYFHSRSRLELHRLEIEHLCVIYDTHKVGCQKGLTSVLAKGSLSEQPPPTTRMCVESSGTTAQP